jgi:hypothetical protein
MSQPDSIDERIDEGDEVLFDLGFTSMTYNESHAALIGLTGLLAGYGFFAGFRELAAGYIACSIAIAFGLRKTPGDKLTIAAATVRHEHWWYTTSLVFWTLVGAIVWVI